MLAAELRRKSCFNPRPPSRADDLGSMNSLDAKFQSASALASGRCCHLITGSIDTVSIRVRPRERTIASGSTQLSHRVSIRVRPRERTIGNGVRQSSLHGFNPRPPSRADDTSGRFDYESDPRVSIRVRPRERTMAIRTMFQSASALASGRQRIVIVPDRFQSASALASGRSATAACIID